ncbi:MAG: EAL domain-containing protein [Pseudomonadota bacterium]
MGSKLHIMIQVMLLVVLISAQFWIMERFRSHILNAAESRAIVTADGVINGMNMLMLTGAIGNPDNRKLYIKKMSASAGVKELRIIRGAPVVQQFGPGLPEEQPLDEVDRRVLAGGKLEWMRFDDGLGNPELRVVVPFVAAQDFRGTNCLQCHHVPAGTVNGAASVVLDLREDYAMIGRINLLLWTGQAVLQLLLFLLSGRFIRTITNPLKQLETVMGKIQQGGDLALYQGADLHVPARHHNEVGRLSAAFNHMAKTLQEKMLALHEANDVQQRLVVGMREEQARLIALLSAMNLGIMFVSRDNKVIQANPTFFSLWQIPPATALPGSDISGAFELAASRVIDPPGFLDSNPLCGMDGQESMEVKLGDGRVIRCTRYDVRDSTNQPIGWLWVFEDVTQERLSAEQMIYLAERDALTGQYNRRRFQDDLLRSIAEAQRNDTVVALLFFDLDGFKYINDTYGHSAGDALLIRIASEIETQVRRNEVFYRLGGDEFAVIVPNTDREEVMVLAERIVHAIRKVPFQFEGSNMYITASLGIGLFPLHAATADELVAHADAAMYQAKEAGKNTWRMYQIELDSARKMLSRLSWQNRIEHALEANLLRLHFQGVYRRDRTLLHVEALVRMVDEDNPECLVLPASFIPVAEKTGKILDIDRWVLHEVITLLATSPAIPPIAVNISGRSFDDPTLPGYIREEIRRRQVDPSRLIVELTETSAVVDLHDAQRFIEALHEVGCLVCLDDFGSGFSSFAYLKHLPVDMLKIDGLFIRDLPNDEQNCVFVKAIVDVARGMGKITVAEFVENARTLEMLQDYGVDRLQGFYLDQPCADHPALRPLG